MHMFHRRYLVKVYYEGKNTPELAFYVDAQYVKIEGHGVTIDGMTLNFSEQHYIAVEMA